MLISELSPDVFYKQTNKLYRGKTTHMGEAFTRESDQYSAKAKIRTAGVYRAWIFSVSYVGTSPTPEASGWYTVRAKDSQENEVPCDLNVSYNTKAQEARFQLILMSTSSHNLPITITQTRNALDPNKHEPTTRTYVLK